MRMSPCKDCPVSGTLHTRCDKYQQYHEEHEKANAARRRKSDITSFEVDAVYRIQKHCDLGGYRKR